MVHLPKLDTFHWSRGFSQCFNQDQLSLDKRLATDISYFICESFAYAIKAKLQWGKFLQNQMHAVIESHEISQSILMPTLQYFQHILFIIFQKYSTPFPLKPWQCDIPPQNWIGVTKGLTEFSHKIVLSIHLFDKSSIPNEEGCVPTTKGCGPHLSAVF